MQNRKALQDKKEVHITDKLTVLKGIGEKTAALFRRMGVETLEELLHFYPRDYDKMEEVSKISELKEGNRSVVRGTVTNAASERKAGKLTLTFSEIADGTGKVQLSFFNMPYLKRVLKKGAVYYFRGRILRKGNRFAMEQPQLLSAADYENQCGKLLPIYPLTSGLNQKSVRKAVKQVLDAAEEGGILANTAESGRWKVNTVENSRLEGNIVENSELKGNAAEKSRLKENTAESSIEENRFSDQEEKAEFLPEWVLKKYHFASCQEALYHIHFPEDAESLAEARKRLVFDEFLVFLLLVRKMKEASEAVPNGFPMLETADTGRFLESLPFRLTADQLQVWREICEDMTGSYTMNRLIQGDVGSGKTVLAALALLLAVSNGYQGAMMAPTEVLALQHFRTLQGYAEKYKLPFKAVLLTGSLTAKEKREAYAGIVSGDYNLVIGTHALIQDKVKFRNLAIVITDEQHRFGVRQREIFAGKGENEARTETGESEKKAETRDRQNGLNGMEMETVATAHKYPHVLVMSATPIPRTLAMILYGDLHISVIRQLPAERQPIKNCVVGTGWREKAYRFLEKEIREGRQVFVVCPMIEPSEESELENVKEYTEKLRNALPSSVRIEMLHGKMKTAEKNRIMDAFSKGLTDILVSTTVIEVGVNIPNAAVMMIENAERFGLAQLHQLRGRVGRGRYQSYCIFINGSDSEKAGERLDVLNHSNDGFYIAEQDLKLRGPGDMFGIRQSGMMNFQIADIYQDADVLAMADQVCAEIAKTPDWEQNAENRALAAYLQRQDFICSM